MTITTQHRSDVKERHPHLFPVWDAEKRAIRSVNLATVTRIATGGTVHTYASQGAA